MVCSLQIGMNYRWKVPKTASSALYNFERPTSQVEHRVNRLTLSRAFTELIPQLIHIVLWLHFVVVAICSGSTGKAISDDNVISTQLLSISCHWMME